jgi:protein-glutamine gamma-glutamyltransferase
MSDVQIAVLGAAPGSRSVPRRVSRHADGHPLLQIVAFAALALYGSLRWGTLVTGGSTGRLVGLVALTSLLAAGPLVAARSRALAALGAVFAAAAALAIAGIPVDWIVNLRIAVTARAIGDGLSTLPNTNVPYAGVDEWVRLTILLGATVLLVTAALVLTFVPRHRGYVRLAGAALPLITLAVIPATILRPGVPYVEGVLLFALLVVFLWGDLLERNRMAGVLLPCGVAATVALIVAPLLDTHHAWINPRTLASALAPGKVETFDWAQRYGPLHWPRTRKPVLEVQASRADYWKAQNLDVFDGQSWTAGRVPVPSPWQDGVSASALRRWTETLEVTVRAMSTNDVIAAGSADPPRGVPGGSGSDVSPGTWLATQRLHPGASYRVTVYSPHPTPAQLALSGASYPRSVAEDYLSIELPEVASTGLRVGIPFPAFGTTGGGSAAFVATAMRTSPYAGAFALAQRLARGAATPYAYLERVMHYLGRGFRYDEHPAPSAYPLETFLESSKLGYCQHFAGAMALLLRMGGVPARVAVGFTSGSYDSTLRHYTVIDSDAHAWVEAWFPHYGWVRFDPTPRADPALGGHGGPHPTIGGVDLPAKQGSHGLGNQSSQLSRGKQVRLASGGSGASETLVVILAPVLGLGLLVALASATVAREGRDPVTELGRAFARTGRPLRSDVTLAAVELRIAATPEAAAYVRGLRLARFGSTVEPPSLRRRRAFRRALADGLGVTGRLRALWAVPPRWKRPASWSRLNWIHGRRLRALPARDGAARGGAQPSGDDSADPRA